LHVLSISPAAEDHIILSGLSDGLAWRFSGVANCSDALAVLTRNTVSIIFCETIMEDGTWKDVLFHLKTLVETPLLVVTSRLADEYLWAEVLNMGGYDVLAKPFNDREVCHVLTTAVLARGTHAQRTHAAGAD
jgi:DNA-binding response OmpR family regulator